MSLSPQKRPQLTKNRQAVLDILSTCPSAMSAYDVLDRLHASDSKWKPATVYRALNFLIEQGYIHRIESEQKFISCGHIHKKHDRHFLICEQCGGVEESVMPETLLQQFQAIAESKKFSLHLPYLEFRGICEACRKLS